MHEYGQYATAMFQQDARLMDYHRNRHFTTGPIVTYAKIEQLPILRHLHPAQDF